MAQTVFITGASSGIGKATATLFQEKGWNVLATMRRPENEDELTKLDNVFATRLDVTDSASIEAAVAAAIERFGRIDVLVNNAGYGAYGTLEAFTMDQVKRQFDTNVVGLLEVTKAVLPHFRANRSGTIVNISSIAGRMGFPLGTLYHGSKFAVEGISESLQYETGEFGVKVKIIEPGAIGTDFSGRSFVFTSDESMVEYKGLTSKISGALEAWFGQTSHPSSVAEVIHQAVTDGTDQLRYPAGMNAAEMLAGRKAADDATFAAGIKTKFGL